MEVPKHIAFIMDGNGRWAKKRGLPRTEGHKNAEKAILTTIECAQKLGTKMVTLYAFSVENWERSNDEKNTIFDLLRKFLNKFKAKCIKYKVKVRILGEKDAFKSNGLYESICNIENVTKDFTDFTLNIALNYGARQEIVAAVNKAIEKGEKVTEESFSKLLYTKGDCDPDLIVRTSGELRLSNFLLFQSAYSELYFTDCLWPDFDKKEFDQAIESYQKRKRRFGKV